MHRSDYRCPRLVYYPGYRKCQYFGETSRCCGTSITSGRTLTERHHVKCNAGLKTSQALFFALDHLPFYVPLALPGGGIAPEKLICFRFDGQQGLYIHPNVWHEGVFTLRGMRRFFDKQSAVHARVSVNFDREFGCLLQNLGDIRSKRHSWRHCLLHRVASAFSSASNFYLACVNATELKKTARSAL
ncbi:ureidoglycolate lyase [Paraburkholderia caledonica]|uniref:ureidoglycolate lyase n=1 Tax=Paraburkholderia caledonica TaxID=134536 RepID=UPI00351DE88A